MSTTTPDSTEKYRPQNRQRGAKLNEKDITKGCNMARQPRYHITSPGMEAANKPAILMVARWATVKVIERVSGGAMAVVTIAGMTVAEIELPLAQKDKNTTAAGATVTAFLGKILDTSSEIQGIQVHPGDRAGGPAGGPATRPAGSEEDNLGLDWEACTAGLAWICGNRLYGICDGQVACLWVMVIPHGKAGNGGKDLLPGR